MNKFKAAAASGLMVLGLVVGVPVAQAVTEMGVATADARPDGGRYVESCRTVRVNQGGYTYTYLACKRYPY